MYVKVPAQFRNKINRDVEKEIINKSKVKIKAFEPSKFAENLRDYSSFIEDFEKLVKCTYGPDPYARHYKL